MKWNSVTNKLPEYCMEVLCVNMEYGMETFKAVYHPTPNVFILYNPNMRETIALDVTHWIEIPELPYRGEKK